MTHVGAESRILTVSAELKSSLQEVGQKQHFAADEILFHEDDGTIGVFLLLKGKVRMSVKGLPKLDRLFSAGAALGLPSSYTGHPYSLTAQAVTAVEAIQIDQEDFLELMRARPELCRETTELLGKEVTFIQAALAERRKQASHKFTYQEAVSS
jgi:CRP-like cAMP-binding protein